MLRPDWRPQAPLFDTFLASVNTLVPAPLHASLPLETVHPLLASRTARAFASLWIVAVLALAIPSVATARRMTSPSVCRRLRSFISHRAGSGAATPSLAGLGDRRPITRGMDRAMQKSIPGVQVLHHTTLSVGLFVQEHPGPALAKFAVDVTAESFFFSGCDAPRLSWRARTHEN